MISRQYARTVRELHNKSMYRSILALSDSCGASTLFEHVDSPRFISIGSSSKGEKSMSHGFD
jgi:glycosylphosphatidylinositol transamidase (GPIT) subunit GPI8